MTRFLDTNIFIRYLTRDDEVKAQAAYALLHRIERGEETALTSDAVIAEVVFILQSPRNYGLARERVRSLVEPVVWLRGLRLPNKRLYDRVFDLYCATRMSFIDAYNVALMESNGVSEIYSYDTDFDRVEGILRLEPEAYLPTIIEGFLDFIQRNSALLQAIVSEIWTDRELRERFLAQVVAPVFDTGARYLELQMAAGAARPCHADVVIPAIAGSLFVVSMLQVMDADHLLGNCATADLVEELTQLYMRGLVCATGPSGAPAAVSA